MCPTSHLKIPSAAYVPGPRAPVPLPLLLLLLLTHFRDDVADDVAVSGGLVQLTCVSVHNAYSLLGPTSSGAVDMPQRGKLRTMLINGHGVVGALCPLTG